MIALPELSLPDPEVAGEGSLDPLGLGAIADRMADLLVPDVRARMRRIRFLTAIAVGSLITEDLWDEPPGDNVSTPPICFEWIVLESFVRKGKDVGALEATGVPGSQKAQQVIRQGKRLTASNYLKAPSVFGFNGVYQPLAHGLHILDADRRPAERAEPLVRMWEAEEGLDGFLDGRGGTSGGGLRSRLTAAVRDAYRAGRCTAEPSAHLWGHVARALQVGTLGTQERALLREWLLDPAQDIRRELALALARYEAASEPELLTAVLHSASAELTRRINAVLTYERFSRLLVDAFDTLRHLSWQLGTQALTTASASTDSLIRHAARELPGLFAGMAESAELVGFGVDVQQSLGRFCDRHTATDFVAELLAHHAEVQARKQKRTWFDEIARGVVVRTQYGLPQPVEHVESGFVHPFRVSPLWTFMEQTWP